ANYEKSPLTMNAEQEPGGAEVAVRNDAIASGNARQCLTQQRPFLGMRVFAGNDVGDQAVLRVVEHQRLPWQGGGTETTQLENAMLGIRPLWKAGSRQ